MTDKKLFQDSKPVIILPEGEMSAANIAKLNENGLCVVEAKEPAKIQFLDPIPAAYDRTHLENTAIAFSRKILSRGFFDRYTAQTINRSEVVKVFVDILVEGTPLDTNPTLKEIEEKIFSDEKRSELQRLARLEAKAERDAVKKKAVENKPK